ncbi:hypothetical protein GCM10010987_35990 [Bradyrhizobium guangdongense]|uniref:Uncharacterized protein n=2 Tax=Bradyrhizobium TaxID=374 RepID=A0AAE5X8Y4_9BRAD|nr:hypothetical protein X265_37860 [Bradyrhizobium guangdongense]QAU50899.1 hypothetical protein XH91_37060 [Bradyrhizobium guangzhouense]QOZ49512.1 hypothetical protein XH89_39200 [Bradyrhizobium sp. CCBAU 53340]QOZ56629.1 hypothetical protein XH90_34995 [Bradyrhizobium sp. CCBAU 53338]QOZ64624.1 hypothetical protein XH86_38945 [Bradyrhizobium guangdongense]
MPSPEPADHYQLNAALSAKAIMATAPYVHVAERVVIVPDAITLFGVTAARERPRENVLAERPL